jgi:hypothetical protein
LTDKAGAQASSYCKKKNQKTFDYEGLRGSPRAAIRAQADMMLATRFLTSGVLADHAFIVAGGETTKAAGNFLGEARGRRSRIVFMERDDILNLFTITNLSLPAG